MKLEFYTQWEVVTIVQLVVFIVLLVLTLIFAIARKNKLVANRVFFNTFYLAGFALFQIVGAILGLVLMHQDLLNINLYIATYIFDSVASALLIRSSISIMRLVLRKSNFDGEIFPSEKILKALLLAGIGTFIGGSATISTTSSNSTSLTLLKVGCFLFLAVLAVCAINLVRVHSGRYSTSIFIFAITSLFIIVRLAYSLTLAFENATFSVGSGNSKFLLYFGDYKFYAGMALSMNALATGGFLVNYYVLTNDNNIGNPRNEEVEMEDKLYRSG